MQTTVGSSLSSSHHNHCTSLPSCLQTRVCTSSHGLLRAGASPTRKANHREKAVNLLLGFIDVTQLIWYWCTLQSKRAAGIKPGVINASHYSDEDPVALSSRDWAVCFQANPKFPSLHDFASRLAVQKHRLSRPHWQPSPSAFWYHIPRLVRSLKDNSGLESGPLKQQTQLLFA